MEFQWSKLPANWLLRKYRVKQNYPFGVRSPTLLPYIGYFHHELRIDDYPVLLSINPDKHPPPQKLKLGNFFSVSIMDKREHPFWGAVESNVPSLYEKFLYSIMCERCFNAQEKFL